MWDPWILSSMIQMFSVMEARSDDFASSYQKLYGKPLEIAEANAGPEIVKRLPESKPVFYNENVKLQ